MVNFSDWLGTNSPADESVFAAQIWSTIQHDPASIAFVRGSTTLAAQTVRVTYSNMQRESEGKSGAMTAKREVVVFGVKGHPSDDVPDTDIQRGDQFSVDGRGFKVVDVIAVLGGIQATTEAVS